MAINIMDQLNKDLELQSGHGGTIVDKINQAIVKAGGEAHAGTIEERLKALKAIGGGGGSFKTATLTLITVPIDGEDTLPAEGYSEPILGGYFPESGNLTGYTEHSGNAGALFDLETKYISSYAEGKYNDSVTYGVLFDADGEAIFNVMTDEIVELSGDVEFVVNDDEDTIVKVTGDATITARTASGG